MKVKIAMKNPKTGEVKEVKVGWSWTLFFFSGFWGIPLFLRKLNTWGFVYLAYGVANCLTSTYVNSSSSLTPEQKGFVVIANFLVLLGMSIFMAIKGNAMTAKNYLELGWEFTTPDSEFVKLAKNKWGINL
jgi:Protein of unknown function (DUF2628).